MPTDESMPYLEVFELLRGSADKKHMVDACHRVFVDSDEFRISNHTNTFTTREVSMMTDMLFEFCTDWSHDVIKRVIKFDHIRVPFWKETTYANYAEHLCWDLLYQSRIHTAKFPSSLSFTVDEIEEYLIALWHRYRACELTAQFFSFAPVCKCIEAYAEMKSLAEQAYPSVDQFALRVMRSFYGGGEL